MDCDGTSCHAECELRHLDDVECLRYDGEDGSTGAWNWPDRSRLVLCAGPERSASTWLYNAVRLLHRECRVPCDSYWIHTLTREKLERRLKGRDDEEEEGNGRGRGRVVCVKTHEWQESYAALVPDVADRVVLTHRDLRGVVASYRRVGWDHSLPRGYVEDHMRWRGVGTLDLEYEDVVRDDMGQLRKLASHLGLEISDGSLRRVGSLLRNVDQMTTSSAGGMGGGGVDQVTKIWPGHISSETRKMQGRGCEGGEGFHGLNDKRYGQYLCENYPEYMKCYGYKL